MGSQLSSPVPSPSPAEVREVLGSSVQVTGSEMVLDLDASQGSTLVDAVDGAAYLDMFTFFASSPIGLNHPGIVDDPEFAQRLLRAAATKPPNAVAHTAEYAEFVATFRRVFGDADLPHLFFIEGGAAAVENALKVAFDWKSRQNEAAGRSPELGSQVLHLREAFHGRSGYTLSLTNTSAVKVARFPKFDWPRIDNPYLRPDHDIAEAEDRAIAQAEEAFRAHPHDIACFLAEPIQGEGGDHHFRPEFLQRMQHLVHDNDALFVLDEVQTGAGLTGTPWAYQQLGLAPDVVAFGKKIQTGGIMAGRRVDEIPDHVFAVPSRIASTWAGGLADMVRSTRMMEVIERDGLIEGAARTGAHLLGRLEQLTAAHAALTDPRGRGLMCAVSLPDASTRARLVELMRTTERVLVFPCGDRSVRFRPALNVTNDEIDQAVDALDRTLGVVNAEEAAGN